MSRFSPAARLVLSSMTMLCMFPQVGIAQAATTSLEVTVSGISSTKGVIRLALCPPQAGFPDCKDKAIRTASLPIENGQARAVFSGLDKGTYAIAIFHDANNNGKLDTFAGIPKEGYGFSRNPPFRPRAPKWSEAVIEVQDAATINIRMRYVF